jgi:NADH-quinone oxidoreductase subunit E
MAYTDEDFQIMDSIIKRYPRSRSAIMPLLHYVQSKAGFVTNEGIEVIAKVLQLEAAEVTAVSTFYTQYKRSEEHTSELQSPVCLSRMPSYA